MNLLFKVHLERFFLDFEKFYKHLQRNVPQSVDRKEF